MDKFWWAVAASVGIHVLGVGVFWPRIPHRLASPPQVRLQVTMVSPVANVGPTISPGKPVAPAARADTAAPPQDVLDEPVSPHATESSDSVGYLPIDAVDQPAMPLDDWVIDPDVLPRGYTLRLVLELWISATGQIDKWELQEGGRDPELAQKALAQLEQTLVQPALLHQVAVPSFRRLEVIVTRE